MNGARFRTDFQDLTGNPPFPWQIKLFTRLKRGKIDRSLDIPTGLGKTAVMAIWLIARAWGARLPRRLAYVVDRRAVVDQATEVASGLRVQVEKHPKFKERLGLGDRPLPISTLRGQHVDNREWLEDPAAPAIIVGTVDMIGSRLLFEGYGVSRKMRPFHAGLLGADTLVVLDEAHLVPPFEKLIEAIAVGRSKDRPNDRPDFGPREEVARSIVPAFELMSLSATGRPHSGTPFTLTARDLKRPEVRKRLDAKKRLSPKPLPEGKTLPESLADEAWGLTKQGTVAARVIVYCDKPKEAEEALKIIERKAKESKGEGIPATELFVGGRRVKERDDAARWLKDHGFIAGSAVPRSRPAFVFATSAGEVGVDLDADHMVCDLVAWERMVQRLGRVNRRGDGDARIIVLVPKPRKSVQDALGKAPGQRTEKEKAEIVEFERLRAVQELLEYLPIGEEGDRDANPEALRQLKQKAEHDERLGALLRAATTPAPLRPALTRAVVDAWSMTSLKEHTGRPAVGPWLRGWDNDPPQTSVVWRTHLPTRKRGEVTKKEVEKFFEAAPPHASEVLETETARVLDWLTSRAKGLAKEVGQAEGDSDTTVKVEDVVAIVLSAAGDCRKQLTLQNLSFNAGDKKADKERKELEKTLAGATLVVGACCKGLKNGRLDPAEKGTPPTVDDGREWLSPGSEGKGPVVRFRVRKVDVNTGDGPNEPGWHRRLKFPTSVSDTGEPDRWLVVEKWQDDGATEDDRSLANRPQLLDGHQKRAEYRACELARRTDLPASYTEMLAIAARLHDEGKRASRWQRAFNAERDGVYAKTVGPLNLALLDGYRHEFTSLAVAARDREFQKLSPDLQELALHLIAAHHGFARPVIGTSGCEDAPPSKLEERAREVALRFARLQRRWGPWGLAWWESLLRAADNQASGENKKPNPGQQEGNG